LNAAIAELVAQINNRVTRHLGASRRALFEDLEQSALKPLPAEPYVFAEWKECRVGLDYHVEIAKHYYSVPHQLLREKVWARITARTIEVFHRGKRIAAHVRSSSNRKHTTVREHMPSSHRRYADWTPERIRRQAGAIGRHTSALDRPRWPPVAGLGVGRSQDGSRTGCGCVSVVREICRTRRPLCRADPNHEAEQKSSGADHFGTRNVSAIAYLRAIVSGSV
jgi:hypothetical protein